MSQWDKIRDGVYEFDAGQGARVRIGNPDASRKLRHSIRAEKWGGLAYLALNARDVEPGLVAERMTQKAGKDVLEASFKQKVGGRWVDKTVAYHQGSVKTVETFGALADVPDYDDFDLDFPAGVELHYQPALDLEETLPPAITSRSRPTEIEGSFAVYFNRSGRMLDPGGVEIVNYETGKLAHLRNLWWEDVDGTRAWCRMELVGGGRTLRVHNPKLAMAGFRQFVRDPNLGFESKGGTSTTWTDGYVGVSVPWSSASSGTLTSVSCYILYGSGTVAYNFGVYRLDGSNVPTYLLGVSESGTISGAFDGWKTANIVPVVTTDPIGTVGISYWGTGADTIYYDNVGGSYAERYAPAVGNHVAVWSAGASSAGYKFSRYLTWTALPAAGGASPRFGDMTGGLN